MSATDIRRRFVSMWIPVVCVVLVTSMPDAVTARQQTDPRSQVTAAVRDAIRLLEANQHLDFIKKYMRPSELERQVAKFGSLENVAAEFVKQQRAPLMLKALQAALELEPAFDSDGTRARYTLPAPIGGESALTLQKIGDRWYIRD